MTRTLPVLTIVLALAACAPALTAVPTVPPPQAEARPAPPVSDVVLDWRPGDWEWTGNSYVWRAGEYEPAAGHGAAWLPGHWELSGPSYAWIPGHWM